MHKIEKNTLNGKHEPNFCNILNLPLVILVTLFYHLITIIIWYYYVLYYINLVLGYRENSSFGHARNKEFGCRRGRFRGDRSRGTGRFGDGGSDAGPFQGQENNTENTGRYRGGRRRPPYLQNPLGNSSSARTGIYKNNYAFSFRIKYSDQQKDSIPQKTDIVPEPISTPQLSLREKRKNNEYESPLNRLARH